MSPARAPILSRLLLAATVALLSSAPLWAQQEAAEEPAPVVAARERPVQLYRVAGRTTGLPLRSGSRASDARDVARQANGRVTPLLRRSFSALRKVKKGDVVLLPITDRQTLRGKINIVRDEDGYVRVGGPLANGAGSFFVNTNDAEVSGLIQLVREGIAFEVQDSGRGKVLLREVRRSDVVSPGEPQP